MKALNLFLLKKDVFIPPFGDHVRDTPIKNRSLADWQAAAAADWGMTAKRIESRDQIEPQDFPCLLADEDLFFTASTLREFVRVSEPLGAATRLLVKSGTAYFRQCASFQEGECGEQVAYGLRYLTGPGEREERDALVDIGERHIPINVPLHMSGPERPVLPGCLRPIFQIRHPIHIVWVNVIALNLRFVELQESPLRRLALVAKSRSINPSRLFARMNRIGKRCSIHPTAYLEGVEIGDDVRIGANALIRMSSIGDGCDIGDGAVIRHAVLGPKSVTFDDLNFNFAVTYPETFLIHGPYNLSVFGRQSAMFATILTDFRLDGKPIRIEIDGKLQPCPFPFVGSFIGHRTRVAGGSIIAPGRLIPNDLLIFSTTTSTLTHLDADLPRGVPLAIEDGRLRAIAPRRTTELRDVSLAHRGSP